MKYNSTKTNSYRNNNLGKYLHVINPYICFYCISIFILSYISRKYFVLLLKNINEMNNLIEIFNLNFKEIFLEYLIDQNTKNCHRAPVHWHFS